MGVGEEQGPILQEQSYSALNDSTWTELLRYITEEKCNPFVGPEAHSRWIPTDEHIAVKWAESFGYPFQDSFQLTSSITIFGNTECRSFIPKKTTQHYSQRNKSARFFLPEYQNTVYATLADLNLPIYVTTNYDHFMEVLWRARVGILLVSFVDGIAILISTLDVQGLILCLIPKVTNQRFQIH